MDNLTHVYKINKQLIYKHCSLIELKLSAMETAVKKCVYVLEDNTNIADIIEFLLIEELYEVRLCKNIRNFWQQMRKHIPDFIVLDIILPDGTGTDVCKALKSNIKTHHIPVMMMSGNNYLSKVKDKCQAESYINKPFDLNDFMGRVDYYSHLR